MTTSFIVFLLTISYAIFLILLGKMSGKINSNLGAGIFSAMSAVIPFAYYFIEKFSRNNSLTPTTTTGLIYAILAGIIIAFYNILLILLFTRGGNLSYVFPIVYGAGAIAIPSLVGWLVFNESISPLQGTGVGLILAGIVLVIFSKL